MGGRRMCRFLIVANVFVVRALCDGVSAGIATLAPRRD